MSHLYRHESLHDAAPRARSPKRNPPHTSRDLPGNPVCAPGSDYSPSKLRAHLNQTSKHDSDQSLLEMLTSTVACLKQKNMDLEALGCLEQSLWLKRRMFGVDNSVVHRALNEVMLSYNSVAMQYLAQGQFDQCLAMLRKAEAITAPGNFKRCQALQILTFNNIGCCYRKLGKLKSALKYLKEAAQIGSGSAHVRNLSITHLNLCAIQSQLGRHDLALEHAQAAIFHTQEELVSLEDGAHEERGDDGGEDRDFAALADALDPKSREEKIISLAVAYHNLAVELEFNGRGEASLQWYKKALQLVWKYRASNEALCESFKKIFLDAKKKQQTANVRQNGIPASSCTATNGRRPLARPRSAHASSRSGNELNRGDVSYSSTVASHCYKATKPSTAGLRYGSPRSAAAAKSGKPQRPASATTRQRPVSAKPSTRTNYRSTSHGRQDSADAAFELHWNKLEKEHALNDFQAAPAAPTKAERRERRPQSAGGATAAARRRTPVPIARQRQPKLQGQVYFAAPDEDLVGDDEDYGVILDDGDENDDFDNYPGTIAPRRSNNQRDREDESGRLRSRRSQRSGAAASRRHRRALDESHSQSSLEQGESTEDNESVAPSREGPEESSPSVSLTGYSGDDDTDPDLPAQRVCHMEYLRRMKKLAENIKEDLNGVGIKIKPASLSKSPTRRQDDPATSECGSNASTPRSATSKIRDRIEQARRESQDNLRKDNSKANEIQTAMPVDDDGVELHEDAHTFESEIQARDAELQLFREAAGCRLQSFFRGQHCRAEVKQLKQAKLEHDSASLIQRQVRRYIEALEEGRRLEEERLQLELQKEEVEDMAACLIQRLCRRGLSRKTVEVSDDEDLVPSPGSQQRRPFSIGDVVLGAAVKKASHAEPPHLSAAATVPHMNLTPLQEPEAPRRSSTVSSIPLSGLDGVSQSTAGKSEPTPRSEVYDDDDEWKAQSVHSPPRSSRRSNSTPSTPSVSSTVTTPRTATETRATPQQRPVAVTPRTSRSTADEDDTRRHLAANRIQAAITSFAVRRRIAQNNAGDLSRTYIERKHFNVALDTALAYEQEFLEELSAIKIQALVRGRQSRLLSECVLAGEYSAASSIQRSFRSHRRMTQRVVDDGVRIIAARTIQQVFRDYEARRAAVHQTAVDEELRSVQQIAASTIQSFWRQSYAARDDSLEAIEAATCIQALGRGHLTRRSLKSLHGSSSDFSKHSSAFSMSSSAERLIEDEHSESADSLGINVSFLPASIRELYLSPHGAQLPSANNQIHAQEIADLGLTFQDFLRELETCSDEVVGSSALDAMRVVVDTSPEANKTLANVAKVAQALDRRLQEGFWNEAIEASSIALLHAFRDVLDAQ